MAETPTYHTQIGPGFLGTLTIVFVVAKLTGYLDWSWWWVFSPMWVPTAVVLGVSAVVLVVAIVLALVGIWMSHRKG